MYMGDQEHTFTQKVCSSQFMPWSVDRIMGSVFLRWYPTAFYYTYTRKCNCHGPKAWVLAKGSNGEIVASPASGWLAQIVLSKSSKIYRKLWNYRRFVSLDDCISTTMFVWPYNCSPIELPEFIFHWMLSSMAELSWDLLPLPVRLQAPRATTLFIILILSYILSLYKHLQRVARSIE